MDIFQKMVAAGLNGVRYVIVVEWRTFAYFVDILAFTFTVRSILMFPCLTSS